MSEPANGMRGGGVYRRSAAMVIIGLVLALLTACGGVPTSSSPQPISSFARQGPSDSVPEPQADMDPEALVRAFLKATAAPADGHAAARKFLTTSAAGQWDDRGAALILDEINTYVDQRSENSVRMRLVGDNVGVLMSDGQLTPATGRVETTVTLSKVGRQWRIDGTLPERTMIDRTQFEVTHRAVSAYFTDRTRSHLVPDPRWLYFGLDSDATTLVGVLLAGPAADLASAVDSALPTGASLRGPVTPGANGGVRIELVGIGNLSVRDRTVLAAQIIWTLNGADIGGPYVINADGAPLLADRASGWQTADVRSFDPTVMPATDVGLNVIRDGALLKVTDTGTVAVGGPLGTSRLVRSAALSADGRKVAAVLAGEGADPRLNLTVGDYGSATAPIASGLTVTRPSFGPGSDVVWAVVDGKPIQWVRDDETGEPRIAEIDPGQVNALVRGSITDLQVAPDGVRVGLIVGGQVVFAVLATNADGRLTLAHPRIAAYNIGSRAVSLDWASPTTLMIARESWDSPVVQLSINGTPAVGLLSGNVSPPVTAVVANPTTVYISDQRGVLRLGSSNGQADEYWTEVEPAMTPGTIPVIP